MKRLGLVAALLGLGVACLEDNPCDAYVEYMCECHTDTVEECEAYETTYAVPSADVAEQCVLDLQDQETEDSESGECELTDTDTDI